jgi:hypothetical protein
MVFCFSALDKKAERALRERRSRSETTHIYDCLEQRLLGGSRDRDLILDEVIRARESFTVG